MDRVTIMGQRAEPPLVKNQHIVPRFYLNKFADANRRTVVYGKNRKPCLKSTKKQSTDEYFFEYTINGEATENRYERWFGMSQVQIVL